MNTPLRRIALPALLAIALSNPFLNAPDAAETDIANTPMAVANNVPANFMLMVDNSGSMSNIVPDSPFSATGASYLSGSCTAANQRIDTGNTVSLRVVSGVPKVELASAVGTGRSATSCTSGCTLGTGSGQVCFDDAATYTNVRLVTTQSCGTACTTAGGASYLPSQYSGRYLNWYFGTGTLSGWTSRKPSTETRLEIAKKGAKAALDTIPLKTGSTAAKARVGLATYNGDNGGMLLRAVADLDATQLTNLKTSIDALAATGSTPLSETLADIGQYFTTGYSGNLTIHPGQASQATVTVASLFTQGTTSPHKLSGAPAGCAGAACPVQYWCQGSAAVLMTDGRPQQDQALSTNSYLCDYDGDSGSCTTSGSRQYDEKTGAAATSHPGHIGGPHSYESAGSDYLNDVAQAMYETDLRPDIVAPNGRKKSNNMRTYTVGFADDQAKNDPLLQEAAHQGGGLFTTADNTAALTKAFTNAINDALARDGAAAAVAVTSSQIATNNTSYASSYNSGYWSGDLEAFSLDLATGLPITPHIWSAQEKLDALSNPAGSRKIVSYNGSSGNAFTAANYENAGIGLTAGVIDFLRGSRSGEGSTYRIRQHLLGDIIDAEPVLVTNGSATTVYQPANDGMVHAFDGSTGNELWAYIPSMVRPGLAQLADPTYRHRYYVDATPAAAAVANATFQKKILVGGLGKGGRGYYALDVSTSGASSESDAAAKVLWEALATDANMGFGFGTPLIVKTPNDGWVVLVTSGYNNGSTTGGDGVGRVWALDPSDGHVLLHYPLTTAGTATSPSGLVHLSALANATAGQTTRFVYGGDLAGNVWRFDLSSWTATRIAQLADGSGGAQPITTAPIVRQVSGSATKYLVIVGTGQYLGSSDVPGDAAQNSHATQVQSMYGIIDDTASTPPTLNIRGSNGNSCPSNGGDGDFLCQRIVSSTSSTFTLSNLAMDSTRRGWYFDLPIANGRVNTHPAITQSGTLVFTVNVPTNTLCDPGGSSWFFAVNADNGGAILKTAGGASTYESGWFMDYTIASRAVVIQTSSGDRGLIQFSDKQKRSPTIPKTAPATPSTVKWRRVYWRELM
ncbi:pilus assembly protein [Azoarcus sp. KH32C]|uniref:pilus assembly protein n=1 Tax=Azoarcus sp. KH32C TaxID=748247 RepID=UPI0002386B21|nr:PilC/PilY family type IV pilus protein [Azoarcus sp. KH32C]BAL23293.1 hypothetical protein AZKH_0957 [Azoarcus sp. KH32C]